MLFVSLDYCFLRIFHKSKAEIPVKIENSFSKLVSAKRLPRVLSINRKQKIHRMVFIAFSVKENLTSLPFMSRTSAKKTLTRIEKLSKAYISESLCSFPPQVILYGMILTTMHR